MSPKKKRDVHGRYLLRAVGRKLAEYGQPTLDTILSNGSEPDCWCYNETHAVCSACSLVKLLPQPLPTTSSQCECGIRSMTSSTTSTPYADYAAPVMPGSRDVKHTVKNESTTVCKICGGRAKRGHPDIEVR